MVGRSDRDIKVNGGLQTFLCAKLEKSGVILLLLWQPHSQPFNAKEIPAHSRFSCITICLIDHRKSKPRCYVV